MTQVIIRDLRKKLGKNEILKGINLEIRSGEFFAILGPSGSGKTTLLRLIAGFEVPDSGQILFDDKDVTYLRPDERGVAMVFQNWALWPHMTVYENVAYGLKIKKLPKEEIDKKVRWALELLGLEGMENRYPHQLSGGQQQRVALARALVVEPKVLLLDEPLSNLDARLRLKLRGEIRKLQKELGITAIYVTHDQEEALAIADRLALLRNGRIEESGTPEEIYQNPKKLFTAIFIGKTSYAKGVVEEVDGDKAKVRVGENLVESVAHGVNKGEEAIVVFKADMCKLTPKQGRTAIRGRVTVPMYMGAFVEVRMVPLGYKKELTFYIPEQEVPPPGSEITVYLPVKAVHSYPVEEGVIEEEEEE
ncbi:spermidine/putrescine ABC transporter ATP-binding protein [Ignicoccus pacificus DSM 13166]|uniref:Molybdate/tungstate import ATP-binding protein WtpC n=1 Tax=Ignicoccus pacificus DSM 13166 TaxID=940294 RepID=A0A977KB59_9CREN|nr:spermidine/putrescine ABC transporter ATP-binding protein [Ignicoccus pacificus DSM 13166]